jgi:hypothetical protein
MNLYSSGVGGKRSGQNLIVIALSASNMAASIRSPFSDIYKYIKGKTSHSCVECEGSQSSQGKAIPFACQFYRGITIDPALIPECSSCIEDTRTARQLFDRKDRVMFEPKCFTVCVWWDWADMCRRNRIGCKHRPDDPSCQCITYVTQHNKERPQAAAAPQPAAKTRNGATKR